MLHDTNIYIYYVTSHQKWTLESDLNFSPVQLLANSVTLQSLFYLLHLSFLFNKTVGWVGSYDRMYLKRGSVSTI